MSQSTINILIISDRETGQELLDILSTKENLNIVGVCTCYDKTIKAIADTELLDVILVNLYRLPPNVAAIKLSQDNYFTLKDVLKLDYETRSPILKPWIGNTVAVLEALSQKIPQAKQIILTPHSLPKEPLQRLMVAGANEFVFVNDALELIDTINRVYLSSSRTPKPSRNVNR